VYEGYKELAQASGLGDLIKRIEAGYLEQSPSTGIHWLYRCAEISGNSKLARRPDGDRSIKVLIETRGEGGYVIIAPSHGRVHPSGKPYVLLRGGLESIVTITPEDREALFELARTFDLMGKPKAEKLPIFASTDSGNRPGDLFNDRATWQEVLIPHGWSQIYRRGEVGYWRRPGKDRGVSATTNWQGSDLLYVFSTSTVFEPERGYSKFSAQALLDHSGNFKAAAEALVKQGYGHRPRSRRKGHHRSRPITTWEVRG
jgi:putative DNA primase/helicase